MVVLPSACSRSTCGKELPWTIEEMEAILWFEFQDLAVIALGGIPNKTKVGDLGIDGRIFPVGAEPAAFKESQLQLTERWYPIEVKQKDKVGRPDIDAFQTAMRRSKRDKGFLSPSTTPTMRCAR
jgi:hypothetical protein